MTDHLNLCPHRTTRVDRPDGTILLTCDYSLKNVARCSGDWLHHWAKMAPERVFLAERDGPGWRHVTYAEALAKVRAIASHLLARNMDQTTPILILSGNGIDHGLLSLAAQYVGVPTVPVAEQYALIPAAYDRLSYVADLVNPSMVFVADASQFAGALALRAFAGLEVIASGPSTPEITGFDTFLTAVPENVDGPFGAITHDTLAKILLTSGSTSDPKGVLTTQGMMCTNQAQAARILPFLQTRPPVIVDWLPWNHVFGGSYTFNLMLANGGTLYIDDGKPVKGLFARTLENLALVPGTMSFNVPVGFAQLVDALKQDPALRDSYFSQLDMIFYAGAPLPQSTWTALEDLAARAGVKMPFITSSWGLTETAPSALMQHEPSKGAGIVGVPLPGITVKMVPEAEGRYDVRVKGPNITRGYLNDPSKTKAAFDPEGFFITGDAMRFVDENDPMRGLRFDGRMSEDFKLATGTWVRATALRLDLLGLLAPLATDVVVTGQGRDNVGLLIIPNHEVLAARGIPIRDDNGALASPELRDAIQQLLQGHVDRPSGSAGQVRAVLVLSEPPSMGDGEITAKGNLNFAKLLTRRAALVERLYDPADPARMNIG